MMRQILPIVLALGFAAPASAVTFTDQASFLAAAPGSAFDDFDTASFDGATVAFGGGAITCSGDDCSFYGKSFLDNGGGLNIAISGTNAPYFGTPDRLVFTFSTAIDAFGIFIGGAGDVGAQTLSVELSDGSIIDVFANYENASGTFEGNTQFFGLLSATPFTSLTFSGQNPGDGVFFDNLSFRSVSAVSQPASALLLLSGLAGFGALARRRRDGSHRREAAREG